MLAAHALTLTEVGAARVVCVWTCGSIRLKSRVGDCCLVVLCVCVLKIYFRCRAVLRSERQRERSRSRHPRGGDKRRGNRGMTWKVLSTWQSRPPAFRGPVQRPRPTTDTPLSLLILSPSLPLAPPVPGDRGPVGSNTDASRARIRLGEDLSQRLPLHNRLVGLEGRAHVVAGEFVG